MQTLNKKRPIKIEEATKILYDLISQNLETVLKELAPRFSAGCRVS